MEYKHRSEGDTNNEEAQLTTPPSFESPESAHTEQTLPQIKVLLNGEAECHQMHRNGWKRSSSQQNHITATVENREAENEKNDESTILTDRKEGNDNGYCTTEESQAPDGGWGWVVVVGASVILVLVDTMGQCFGIIFSTFLLELQTPSAVTAWIFNMFSCIWCLTGPPLGPLIAEFGWRVVALTGSLMLSFAAITSAFVTSAWVLFFTFSLVGGIGCGILSNVSYMIVPHYFNKRRGLANSIIMPWDCGGQLISPPLIKYLQDEYAFTGSTLILGAVVLNCCVGAAVFHPVEWHSKPQQVKRRCKNETPKCRIQMLERIMKSTLADLQILKSARAIIIALGATVIFTGYLNFLAFVPFAMQEEGYTLDDAARCVSVSAICNMISRMILASLSDTKIFSFRVCYMSGCVAMTGSMIAFTLVKDLTWLTVIMGVWGCGVGAFMGIFNLIMLHYMGLEKLLPMLGALMLCVAGGYLTIGPLAGIIRDVSQSYAVCMWVLAGMVFSAFIMWIFMPAAVRYDERRNNPKEDMRL